ncbi:hypothetical protein MYCTH_2295905 [Thermothelomyces thermophilus ATCC 42464]|uniref:Uncharacterized protein n=1 Tax=Thermothelomyces thermophilus (strain ATCC 42464 / BCRC 31852 / DSM 1799) TaxID=573729 RepID=G2Q6X3_THET4|nr:uncharacterized protein MYCTH_2295905 [Thermothelomyces thermophilus ATCC 42464]AEO53951.1 hypothetical protein MYCTH_2295905 [Thermothelomyces thermophilus ATCC 42464]
MASLQLMAPSAVSLLVFWFSFPLSYSSSFFLILSSLRVKMNGGLLLLLRMMTLSGDRAIRRSGDHMRRCYLYG